MAGRNDTNEHGRFSTAFSACPYDTPEKMAKTLRAPLVTFYMSYFTSNMGRFVNSMLILSTSTWMTNPLFRSVVVSTQLKKMNQDAPAGFGSIPIPMRFGYFGTPSTAVDSFDNTMDMNTLMEPRAFFDSCISETPPGFSTDESMSPSSLDMNEMSELIQASPDAFYDSVFLDSRHVSSLNPALSSPFVSPVLDFTDENIQPYVARTEYPWTNDILILLF